MKICKLKGLLYLCCLCMMPVVASAKESAGKNHVDTLSFADRLSFRTNMVDWTLLVPNIGVEFDIQNKNWNRWSLGLNVRGNWQTSHTFKPGIVYNISGVRGELRNYWRTRQVDDHRFPPHTSVIDKLFSCRRTKVKHPEAVYYRGIYLSYNEYSFKLSSTGYQGQAYTLGFTYGVVKPLYVLKNGNSIDFELGFSAGLSYTRPHEYVHDRESDCYRLTKISKSKLVLPPTVSDIRVGFVYRVGKYPITKKYRWRYDVDEVFRDYKQQIADSLDKVRKDKELLNRHTDDAVKTFWHVYDSVYNAKKLANAIKKVSGDNVKEATKKSKQLTKTGTAATKMQKAVEKRNKNQKKAADARAKAIEKRNENLKKAAESRAKAAEKRGKKSAGKKKKTTDSAAVATPAGEMLAALVTQGNEYATQDSNDERQGKEAANEE